jgi:hypothetical protein
MPPHYEDKHIRNCHGDVRQCLTCGGRMCDCGWPDPEYRLFRRINCGANEVEDRVFASFDYEPH